MSYLKINFWVLSLIAVAFFNVLGVKYTTPDDISLVVNLFGNPVGGAVEHAIKTARVWTIAADLYAYAILHLKYSSFLIYIVDIAVTFSLYKLISKLLDLRTSLIWLIIYLAVVPMGWWYNILLAYPGFYLDLGFIALAALFFIGYFEGNRPIYKVLSWFFYSISIFHYEIFSLISFGVIILVFVKYAPFNFRAAYKHLVPFMVINVAYALIYVAWGKIYPLDYEGSNFVMLSAPQMLEYFEKILASGFAITSLFQGQELTYTSNVDKVNFVTAKLDFENLIWFYKNYWIELMSPILFLVISMKLVSVEAKP